MLMTKNVRLFITHSDVLVGIERVGFLFYRRRGQQQRGYHADNHINGEKHAPTQAESRNGGQCSPHGDIGCHERRDGFHKLAEGEHRGKVSLDDGRHQRIERSLHQCVSNAQKGEGDEHDVEVFTEDG